MRRPSSSSEKSDPKDFLPCPSCCGFVKRQDLWKHAKSCKFKPEHMKDAPKYQKVQQNAKLMLFPAIYNDSSGILSKLLASMKSDEISAIARNDELIRDVGVMLLEKHGEKQNNLVSQKMRELARLVMQLRETEFRPDARLSDFIKPDKFDVVVSAVKNVSKFHFQEGVQNVATPSLSLKLGHSLKKCVHILRGHALRRKDKDLQEDADNFEQLLESEWSHRVSHHSLNSLSTSKFNKVQLLPLADDLDKLRKFVLIKMSSSVHLLEEQPRVQAWSDLAQATLARLVMFNKRRGGEASKMLLSSYLSRPDWTKVNNPEIMSALSSFGKELSRRQVKIRNYCSEWSCMFCNCISQRYVLSMGNQMATSATGNKWAYCQNSNNFPSLCLFERKNVSTSSRCHRWVVKIIIGQSNNKIRFISLLKYVYKSTSTRGNTLDCLI